MDEARRGATALAEKDYASAITHYTNALASNHMAVDYYIKRSTAYTRLSPADHSSALADAELAVVLAHQRGKRELIAQAQLRRAIALFGLERWKDAEFCFKVVKRLNEKEPTLGIWEKKVEGKLKIIDGREGTVGIKELPDVEVPKTGAKKLEKKPEVAETKQETIGNSRVDVETGKATIPDPKVEGVQTPASKIRHEWYQTPDTVVVSLFAKGVPKDKAIIEFQRRTLSISFPLPTGSDYEFNLDPLYAPIDHTSSTFRILSTKIELILKKTKAGQKWAFLEGSEAPLATDSISTDTTSSAMRSAVPPAPTESTPVYPTSSRTGPKNWDKLADSFTKSKNPSKSKSNNNDSESMPSADADEDEDEDMKIDDNDFEGDEVNGFFKQLYAGADPDTRRAMMKSYQESNGTALSTNWAEVGKGTVETSPPDGMEAKKWGV